MNKLHISYPLIGEVEWLCPAICDNLWHYDLFSSIPHSAEDPGEDSKPEGLVPSHANF